MDLIDICVVPGSNAHCSPMKLFEYMAAGKPVVLPKFKPLLDIVEDGKEGLFFDPASQMALECAILRLVHSTELCVLLGKNGQSLVVSHYTWLANAGRVLNYLF